MSTECLHAFRLFLFDQKLFNPTFGISLGLSLLSIQVVFYNNPVYSLEQETSKDFQGLWHCASVDAVTEADIEKYLENVGLGAMQGEGRKRKMPGSSSRKTRKKAKLSKVMNTHLDNELLKDYSLN